jgi:hypothetical protein
MKKSLLLIITALFIFSACSSGQQEPILEEETLTFELGFDGEAQRSIVTKNTLELVVTYTSNNKGNILENNKILVNNVECPITSITPKSFQLGEELSIKATCANDFKEPQINGIIILEYLQGSTQRLAQGEFLLTVED